MLRRADSSEGTPLPASSRVALSHRSRVQSAGRCGLTTRNASRLMPRLRSSFVRCSTRSASFESTRFGSRGEGLPMASRPRDAFGSTGGFIQRLSGEWASSSSVWVMYVVPPPLADEPGEEPGRLAPHLWAWTAEFKTKTGCCPGGMSSRSSSRWNQTCGSMGRQSATRRGLTGSKRRSWSPRRMIKRRGRVSGGD